MPWLGTFAETNVRLYSVDADGRHGVVFRSLDAARLAVVIGARTTLGLPYVWARMRVRHIGTDIDYSTSRRWPGPRGAGGRITVRPGQPLEEPDELSDWLTARFGLHSARLGRTFFLPNSHEQWPLRAAELLHLDDTLVAAAGLSGVTDRPPDSVLFSDGVRTTFGLPQRVRDAGRSKPATPLPDGH